MNNIKYITSLLIFAEVARLESFSAAAEKLKLSKAAVSKQVKKLEEACGQQLIARHTRGMALTTAGERIFMRCETLWGQLEDAVDELEIHKTAPSGDFSITFPHLCEKDIITPAIVQLCKEFPQINPILKMTDSSLDLVNENLDVAIYGGDLKDSSYRALPIGTAKEIFCASPAYLAKKGQIKKVEQLQKHDFILADWQKRGMKLTLNQDLSQSYEVMLPKYMEVSNLASVVSFIKHNMGVGLIPEFAVGTDVKQGDLSHILSDYQGRVWPFYFVHRFSREKPIHIDRFYQLVKYFFQKSLM